MPMLHMSALVPRYAWPAYTSGAMYATLPTTARPKGRNAYGLLGADGSRGISAARPKSMTRMLGTVSGAAGSARITFSMERSRCATLSSWQWCIAMSTCRMISREVGSSKRPVGEARSASKRSPPSAHSSTAMRYASVSSTSTTDRMYSHGTTLCRNASAFSSSMGSSEHRTPRVVRPAAMHSRRMILSATGAPVGRYWPSSPSSHTRPAFTLPNWHSATVRIAMYTLWLAV
mmetsp:Transcript_147/g.492  ORF Transcript_147/g.492 Transcript_147/m.492 type:complete len:232 (+) Transcript_147:568-1263(+)